MNPTCERIDMRPFDPLVLVRDLSKQYVQRRHFTRVAHTVQALKHANLTIARGSTVALVGESGSGKSTLAKCLALLEKYSEGEIWFDGRNLRQIPATEMLLVRRQIQLIFQESASALNPRMSALEIVTEPLLIQKRGSKADRVDRALEWMARMGLPAGSEDKRPMEFSGGQRQRLAIARALIVEPRLLIFDEALSGLDLSSQQTIVELLAELQAEHGFTYLHISHDLRLMSELADEIAVMHEGCVIEQQPAERLLADPKDSYTRELLLAMPSLETICAERFARRA